MIRRAWRLVYWCLLRDRHWAEVPTGFDRRVTRCEGCGRLL